MAIKQSKGKSLPVDDVVSAVVGEIFAPKGKGKQPTVPRVIATTGKQPIPLPLAFELTAWIEHEHQDKVGFAAVGSIKAQTAAGVAKMGTRVLRIDKDAPRFETLDLAIAHALAGLVRFANAANDKKFGKQVSEALQEWYLKYLADKGAVPPGTPPGATSTTTPAGIRIHDPAAIKEKTGPALGPLEKVAIVDLVPHLDNVERTKEEIAEMAESLKDGHQREPIIYRRLLDKKQILSGHRRYFAAKKLGWTELDARERLECSDAEALIELAAYNGQRKDLDVVEKAKLVRKLCAPVEQDGSGLTREQAAKVVGVESHGTASNLVRLLELPEYWLKLVKSGEIPWTFARCLVPYAKSARLLGVFFAQYEQDKELGSFHENWGHRDSFEDSLAFLADGATRSFGEQWYSRAKFDGQAKYEGTYKCLFDRDEALDERLEVIEIPKGKGAKEIVATNAELFDKLQIDAIMRHVDAKNAKQEKRQDKAVAASKAPAAGPAPKGPTKAELAEKEKERAAQFAKRLWLWKIDWLRYLVARDLRTVDNENLTTPATQRLLLWASVDRGGSDSSSYNRFEQRDDILLAAGGKKGSVNGRADAWKFLETHDEDLLPETIIKFCAGLLYHEKDGPRELVPANVVEGLVNLLQTDPIENWQSELAGPLTAEYFELHTKDQLAELGRELGIAMLGGSKQEQIDQIMTSTLAKSKLPAEIRTVKAPKFSRF